MGHQNGGGRSCRRRVEVTPQDRTEVLRRGRPFREATVPTQSYVAIEHRQAFADMKPSFYGLLLFWARRRTNSKKQSSAGLMEVLAHAYQVKGNPI